MLTEVKTALYSRSTTIPKHLLEHFKTTKWLLASGKLLNRFFVMTLYANLYFVDSGYCETLTSKSTCLTTKSLNQVDSLCRWDENDGYCAFQEIDFKFLPLLILSIIICLSTLPLDSAYSFAVLKIQHYADTKASLLHLGDNANLENPNVELADDELRTKNMPMVNVLLSARIEVMRKDMDKKRVEDELQTLLSETRPDNWHAPRTYRFFDRRGFFSRIERVIHFVELRLLNDSSDPVTAAHVMHTGEERLILNRLRKSRKFAYTIKRNMKAFEYDDQREVYLLQQFLVQSLRGFSRYIAYRHFFEDFDSRKETVRPNLHYLCMILVPLYVMALIFYIFLFGISLEAHAAKIWFIEIIVVALLSTIVIIPLTILLKNVVVTYQARKDILSLFRVMKMRGKTILRRSIGLMTHSHALMHHFNPACRAARNYPELPAARLLMSLNDFDIPVDYSLERSASFSSRLVKISVFPVFLLFFITFLLPYTIQDAIIEALSITGFNFGVLAFYVLASIQVYIPLVFLGTVAVVILGSYYFLSHRFSTQSKVRDIVELKQFDPDAAEPDEEEEDRPIASKLSIKDKSAKGFRFSGVSPSFLPIDDECNEGKCHEEKDFDPVHEFDG